MGAEVAAVCDVYEPNLQAGLKAASTGAKAYTNYKKLLEDKSIDAVLIATPDHWHAQMTIDAVEAGKDVYVEKPMVHKIEEGFRVIEAVRRTKRVVQVGMQRRSYDVFQEAKQIMASGVTGDVRLVNSWWLNYQPGLRQKKLEGNLDWQQWLGSTPKREVDPTRFFNWYYFWDYSGGLMVGQAAHVIDAIQWLMNSTYPSAVTCAGGRVNLAGAEVPDTPRWRSSIRKIIWRSSRSAIRRCDTPSRTTSSNSFTARRRVSTWGARDMRSIRSRTSLDMKPSKASEAAGHVRAGHARAHPEFSGVHQDPQGSERYGRDGELDGGGAVHGDGSPPQRPQDALGRREAEYGLR